MDFISNIERGISLLEENPIILFCNDLELLKEIDSLLKERDIIKKSSLVTNDQLLYNINEELSLNKIYEYLDPSHLPHQLTLYLKGQVFSDYLYMGEVNHLSLFDFWSLLGKKQGNARVMYLTKILSNPDLKVFLPDDFKKSFLKDTAREVKDFIERVGVLFFLFLPAIVTILSLIISVNRKRVSWFIKGGGDRHILIGRLFYLLLKIHMILLVSSLLVSYLANLIKFNIDIYFILHNFNMLLIAPVCLIILVVTVCMVWKVKNAFVEGRKCEEIYS